MSLLSFDEALQKLLAAARPVAEVEEVDSVVATGRVLARAQASGIVVPPLDNSAMDGYAVRLADVPTAGTRLPVSQRIPAGSVGVPLAAGTAARIFTGAPVPPGADAVVMQELCEHAEAGVLINHIAATRREHPPRRRGHPTRRRDPCRRHASLAAGHRPGRLGRLATLPVWRRLKVAVFFTGDELSMPGEPLKPGGIYNSNRYSLRGLLAALGCEVRDLGIVPDSLDATRAALREAAAASDVIVTSGGVSVGEEDHVKAAVQAEGALDLWKIAIKPGKPLAFGKVGLRDTPFIGLPGNPVSTFVTFLMLVRPYLLACQGARVTAPRGLTMRADFDWPKPDRRREFLRARINAEGGLDLFPNQSSGVLTSCAWADGLVDNPPAQAVKRGESVRFIPFSGLIY
jgi:molybdopterin molybdotransferase